ncbi:MAG: hypothetical protein NZ959_00810 [Armatimonadetes bacterium]|nr:hypothetical protein [Armatimonadota bacterium]MDW8121071.1 hypothetical protein [Armatimonadota bacterium]
MRTHPSSYGCLIPLCTNRMRCEFRLSALSVFPDEATAMAMGWAKGSVFNEVG